MLNWFYLDSSHLQRLDEDPAIYSSSEVDQKVNDKALDDMLFSTRPEKRYHSVIRDLVVVVPRSGFASGMPTLLKKGFFTDIPAFRLFSRRRRVGIR